MRVWIGVSTPLAVPLLLGTFSIDWLVKAIFRKERKLVPGHSKLVAILSRFKKALTVLVDGAISPAEEEGAYIGKTFFGVQKQLIIHPLWQAPVLLQTRGSGQIYGFRHEQMSRRRLYVTARVLMDVALNRCFTSF